MLVKRLTLEANNPTAFEFDSYGANSVIVKNETGNVIEFCDGPFDTNKAVHIPAYSWQSLSISVNPAQKPKFYVRAAVAGPVEIDFGPSSMGSLLSLDVSGMVPHTLTLTAGDDTTLTVTLTRLHGQTLDLDTPVSMTSGATVFNGDVISITPAASGGYYAKLKINGVNYGRLESAMTLVIAGETTIETEAIALEEKTVTLEIGDETTLTAARVRLAGMLTDLSSPDAVSSGGKVNIGDIVEFTAATSKDGHHIELTIDTVPAELDESGKVRVTIEEDITAASAAVADGGGE